LHIDLASNSKHLLPHMRIADNNCNSPVNSNYIMQISKSDSRILQTTASAFSSYNYPSRGGATLPGPPLKYLNAFLLLTVLYESLQVLCLAPQVFVFGPPKIFSAKFNRLLKQNKFLLLDMKLSCFYMCLETRVHEK
jgi:hypothetical protein